MLIIIFPYIFRISVLLHYLANDHDFRDHGSLLHFSFFSIMPGLRFSMIFCSKFFVSAMPMSKQVGISTFKFVACAQEVVMACYTISDN